MQVSCLDCGCRFFPVVCAWYGDEALGHRSIYIFSAMDWNAKWEWENLVIFNPKTFESPKQQPTDWGIEEEGVIDTAPFNLSEGKGSTSGSELAQGSSARSSISVCTDSSSKEVMTKKPVAFGAINVLSECFGKKDDMGRAELAETSLPIESSVGYGEPLIGLKLGKRMYFENNGIGSNRKAPSLAGIPVSSAASTAKKIKPSSMITPPLCQVEGCNLDLSSAKEYHRKHRVCESHSKFPKVVVGGLERRFCQQCSRFHSLSDFDEKKRSCRRRLSDHNARRRKPQLDALQINSRRLSSPFSAFACTDGRQQISFASNNVPLVYSRSSTDPTWESACSSKFAISKGCLLKFGSTGGVDGQLQLPGAELPISLPGQSSNRLLLSKGNKDEALTRGFKECALSSNLDAAPDIHCALSLLSNDSWGSFPPANISHDHPINMNHMHQPLMQGFPQNFPQASSEFYHAGHSTDPRTLPANNSSHFQLFKAPYDTGLYSNLFN